MARRTKKKKRKSIKNRQRNRNILFTSLGLLLLLSIFGFLAFGVFQQSFLLDGAFIFEDNLTIGSFSVLAKSTHEFGQTQDVGIEVLCDDVQWVITQNNDVGTSNLKLSLSGSKTLNKDCSGGSGVESMKTFLVTQNLNLKPSRLGNLTIDFKQSGSITCFDNQGFGGISSIWLVNIESDDAVNIFQSQTPTAPSNPSVSDSGQIIITKDSFTLNEDSYEIAILTELNLAGCDTASKPGGSASQSLEITNLVYVEEDVPSETAQTFYRFEDNSCSSISLLPSEKTSNDFDTLSECEDNIASGNETVQTFYRLEDNSCSSISLIPSEKTSNDYDTLSECEDNVDDGNGDFDTLCWVVSSDETCAEVLFGSIISCDDDADKFNTESECLRSIGVEPPEEPSNTLLVIGMLTVIGLFIFVIVLLFRRVK